MPGWGERSGQDYHDPGTAGPASQVRPGAKRQRAIRWPRPSDHKHEQAAANQGQRDMHDPPGAQGSPQSSPDRGKSGRGADPCAYGYVGERGEKTGLAMLREMGLPDPKGTLKRYPFQLSGGMCQRIMLPMALALKPKVLIADEPTSNLDVTRQAEILGRLKSLCKELHSSMILITHDMGIVAQMADQVAVMYTGAIVEFAGVRSLFKRPLHPYI